MKNTVKILHVIVAICIVMLIGHGVAVAAYDPPHVPTTADCGNCHYTNGAAAPSWMTAGSGDNTVNNQRCTQCHTVYMTHSTTSTGSTTWSSNGGWMVECINCHNPHYQMQNKRWGSEGYLGTGTIASIGAWSTVTNQTPVTLSAPLAAEYQGYYLIPNVAYGSFLYKIKTATNGSATLSVGGKIGTGTTFPKAAPGTTYAIVYGKNLKDTISYMNPGGATVGSQSVKMFRPSGTRGPGDTTWKTESVCVVCHTAPMSAAWASITEHTISSDCKFCHGHDEGFKPPTVNCVDCHGLPPGVSGGTLLTHTKDNVLITSQSPGVGAHAKHSTAGYACAACHTGGMYNNPTQGDNKITVGFNLLSSNIGGNYDGKTGRTDFTYGGGGTTTVSTGNTLACTNLYCHSTGQGSTENNATPNYAAPTWNNAASGACGTCHGITTANLTTGSHASHLGSATNIGCDNCHTGAAHDASTYVSASHVNKTVEVAASYTAGGAAGNGYGTCTVAACHGSGSPKWGTTSGKTGCSRCHGDQVANGNVAPAPDTAGHTWTSDAVVGAHQAHLKTWNSISAPVACTDCHIVPATVQAAGHINDATPGVAEITWSTLAKLSWNTSLPPAAYASGTCSNVYCHDSSRFKNAYGGGTGAAPVWANNAYLGNGKLIDCGTCHGNPPTLGHGGVSANVCNGCHNNVNATGDGFINAALHVNGIVEPTTGCNGCHNVNNTLSGKHSVHYDSASDAAGRASTNTSTASNYIYQCGVCHNNAAVGHPRGTVGVNEPWVSFNVSWVAANGGWYSSNGVWTTDSRGLKISTAGACGNVYCHSNASPTGGTNSYTATAWTTTVNCGSCHKTQGTAANMALAGTPQPMSSAHVKHVATDMYGPNALMTCNSCHSTTVSSYTTISDKSKHVDGQKTVSFNATVGGSWTTNCSNTYCHSNGTAGSGTHAALTWTTTQSCTACHPTTALSTGAHAVHVNDTGNKVGFSIGCVECHSATVSSMTTISNYTYHVNKFVNVGFDNGLRNKDADAPTYNSLPATSATAGGSSKAAGLASGNCANVYCHSSGNVNGQTAPTTFSNISWTTTIGCGGCHGDTATNRAHPVYATGIAGSATANSHVKHVESSSITCDMCHATTLSGAWTTFAAGTTVTAAGAHLNRVDDVSFALNGGKWGSYSAASKTCNSTYCHGTLSAAWGTTSNCISCHDASNTGLSLRHDRHYNSATAATVLAGGTDGHTTTNYVYACLQCHPTATHTTGPWNSMADAQLNGAKMTWYTVGASYLTDAKGFKYSNTGTCGTVCHTKDGSTVGSAIVVANWGSGFTGGCGVCHNKPADANPTWSTAHSKHINTYAANTNVTCNACHSGTAASNTALQATAAARTQHPDGTKNVAFSGWASGAGATWSGTQCSNTYCHSAGTSANAGTHAAIAWNTTFGCTACHPTTALATGAHAVHVNDTGNKVGFSITCDECHSQTALNNTSITTVSYHVDKNVNVRFNNGTRNKDTDAPTYNSSAATSTTAGGSSKAAGLASGNCANVYCHSSGNVNGQTAPTTFSNISWTTTIGCGGCHGDTATNRAHPVYATGTAGSATANSHVKHVESSSITCDMCHATTLSGAWTTFAAGTTVTAAGAHLNRVDDVSFALNGGKWGSYSAASKTCNSTYCHGTLSAAWGTTSNCVSCHDASNTGLSLRHDRHYNSATAATVLAGGTDGHTTTNYVYACLQCHPTNSHTTGPWNSMADAQLSGAKMTWYTVGATNTTDAKGFKYSVTGTCGTVCHTKDGSTVGSAIVTANWGSGFTGGCGVCHNKPADANPTWSTAHSKHINTYAANTNVTCNACHSGTAASNTALQATAAARTQHPDGTKNVAFSGWASGAGATWSGTQCSNTYCHSAGTSANAGTHTAIAWNTTFGCTACHGGAASWTTTNGTGAHWRHVVERGYTCNICHNATASSNTTVTGYANHVDKNVSIQINSSYSTVGTSYNGQQAGWNTTYQKTVGSAAGTCNTTTCHGGSTTAWNTINNDAQCVKCHGVLGTTSAQYTAENRTAAPGWNTVGINTSGTVGTLTNGVSNDSKVGAHRKHLAASSVWGATGYSNDIACSNCHTPYTAITDAGHMNGSTSFVWSSLARGAGTDWSSVGGGTLTPSVSGGSCSNVYCHGNSFSAGNKGNGVTVGWTSNAYLQNAPASATSTDCNQCHLSPPAFKRDGVTAHAASALTNCTSCHGHNGSGANHINGKFDQTGGGACNSCHWYDTTDAGAWTTSVGIGGGTGLWMSTNAWGVHVKHIDHLKARYGATLTAASDQWTTYGGTGGFGKVCVMCHSSDKAADHGADGGLATRNIFGSTSNARASHQFGASTPSWNTLTRSCSNLDCHYKPWGTW